MTPKPGFKDRLLICVFSIVLKGQWDIHGLYHVFKGAGSDLTARIQKTFPAGWRQKQGFGGLDILFLGRSSFTESEARGS